MRYTVIYCQKALHQLCLVVGSDMSTDIRNLYRLGVGCWLIISLLAFAGLWNTVNIAIGSTREMQEPLSPDDDAELPPSAVSAIANHTFNVGP